MVQYNVPIKKHLIRGWCSPDLCLNSTSTSGRFPPGYGIIEVEDPMDGGYGKTGKFL